MQLFFSEKIESGEAILTEEEAHHCLNVLRHGIGDTINVTDGKGGIYKGRITTKSRKDCTIHIESFDIHTPGAYKYLSIAIAPTKNIERFEWFVEKAIEIGIHRIIPIQTDRSERTVLKSDRIRRVAISAMKQSNHFYLPEILELTKWSEFLKHDYDGVKLIAHCNQNELPHLKTLITPGNDTLICIGPEGDFTPEEVVAAKKMDFKEIGLGSSRLRTETAGVYAAICFNIMN